jgi:hypothetical protein
MTLPATVLMYVADFPYSHIENMRIAETLNKRNNISTLRKRLAWRQAENQVTSTFRIWRKKRNGNKNTKKRTFFIDP